MEQSTSALMETVNILTKRIASNIHFLPKLPYDIVVTQFKFTRPWPSTAADWQGYVAHTTNQLSVRW